MRIIGKLVLAVIIIAVLAGGWVLAGQSNNNNVVKSNFKIIKDQKQIYSMVEAVEPSFYVDDYDTVHIYGSVKNLSPKQCGYVKFEIDVRNKQGKLLKTLNVKVNDIAPGSSKSYDVNSGTAGESITVSGKITETAWLSR